MHINMIIHHVYNTPYICIIFGENPHNKNNTEKLVHKDLTYSSLRAVCSSRIWSFILILISRGPKSSNCGINSTEPFKELPLHSFISFW